MKHVNKFANMNGKQRQVTTSTELTEDLISKYKKGLGMAFTHTEEPFDRVEQTYKQVAEQLQVELEDALQTMQVNYDIAEARQLERDQMTARCSRLLWAAEHFDEVDECEKIMTEADAALREGE